MGRESTSDMETKEFCGAAWPSKELKRKERNSYCPLNAPEKFTLDLGQSLFFVRIFPQGMTVRLRRNPCPIFSLTFRMPCVTRARKELG